MVNWDAARILFSDKGSLRDVYVFGIGPTDWQMFLDHVRVGDWEYRFVVDGRPSELPTTISEILQLREGAAVILQVVVGGVEINCHFFAIDEIECDIDPRQVCGPEGLDGVQEFMITVGKWLDREVVLTPEDEPAVQLLLFDPESGELTIQ